MLLENKRKTSATNDTDLVTQFHTESSNTEIWQAKDRVGSLEMPYKASYEEDGFLRQIGVGPEEGEPLADNCSLVLVWHTQTYNTYRQGYS